MTPAEAIEHIDRILARRRFDSIRAWLAGLGIEVALDVTDIRRVLPGVAGDALLVEDDDNVAALTEEMLSHLGWRVTRVASAEAALNAIQRFAFDLVFSDVMMPGGKSGIELARVLKAQTNAPPIVLASGYSESVRVEAEDEGVPLLSKPFDINALAAILDAARLRRYQIVTR